MSDVIEEFKEIMQSAAYCGAEEFLMDKAWWQQQSTIDALAVSALKWNIIAKSAHPDLVAKMGRGTTTHCPLCHLHLGGGTCTSCPVFEYTDEHMCHALPLADNPLRTAEMLEEILDWDINARKHDG